MRHTRCALVTGVQTCALPIFGNEYRVGLLGIGPSEPVRATVGLMRAPVVAVERTGDIVQMMVETLGQVVSGRRSVKELGGPLSIARVSGEQMAMGADAFVFLIRSEEHTSELQSLMRISYSVFCLKNKITHTNT